MAIDRPPEAPAQAGDLPYTPSTVRAAAPELPLVDPCPDFLFGVHPTRWCADVDAGRLLPKLTRLAVATGALHVGKDGSPDGLIKRYERDGYTIVPPDTMKDVPGSPHPFYVRRIAVAAGEAHITAWSRAVPGSSELLPDRRLKRAFLAHLVDKGVVPMPGLHQLEAGRQRAQARADRYAITADRDPRAARKAARWRKAVAIWEEAIAAASSPKPAPERKKKSDGDGEGG